MSNKIRPSRVELIMDIRDELLKINSMNYNDKTREFFYHSGCPKDLKKKGWNYNLNKFTGAFDHISFHADGKAFLRLKGESYKINLGMMPDCSFLPINKEIITPLLIHSIYPVQGKYVLDKCVKTSEAEVHLFKFLREQPFSIILFLCHNKVNFNDFLNDMCRNFFGEQDQCIEKNPASLLGELSGEIIVYNEWVIKYIITDLTLPIKMVCDAIAFSDLHLALKDLLHQRGWQPQVMIGNRINR